MEYYSLKKYRIWNSHSLVISLDALLYIITSVMYVHVTNSVFVICCDVYSSDFLPLQVLEMF